jgi:hypothetical protein
MQDHSMSNDPTHKRSENARWTPERRATLSALNRQRWADPEYRRSVAIKISLARRHQALKTPS